MLPGITAITTAAATISVFHENALRPQARAVSAQVAIVAARSAGNSSPLNAVKAQTPTMPAQHAKTRGARSCVAHHASTSATSPTCSPAVTSTCTVPVS